MNPAFDRLNRRITDCRACPRLIAHCRKAARDKRAAYREQTYWARPVPNLGEAPAPLLIVGLAPAAHGANRTGRMFTGDRSGDFLFQALHHAGLANQPHARHRDDGLQLIDCVITAAAHCAPPANKPSRAELDNCRPWLEQTLDLVQPRLIVCLGRIGHDETLRQFKQRRRVRALADHPFAHGRLHDLGADCPALLDTFHPSQQNTFTGRLTMAMLTEVFRQARQHID